MVLNSLTRRLAAFASLGIGAIWLLAIFATALILKVEQQELLDLQQEETATLFLPILTERWHAQPEGTTLPSMTQVTPEEALVYLLFNAAGDVLLKSASADDAVLPNLPAKPGFTETETHVFYVTRPNGEGLAVIYGDPIHERREAYRESFIAFLLPMLALLPIAYLLVGWSVQTGLRPLTFLRKEIATRNEGRLDAIDAGGQPDELRAISATLNALMMRLGQALEGERAFATNAAHELRTPVAVALAQVQRLKSEAADADLEKLERLEAAIGRMSRLVQRLLELARAEAGIGTTGTRHDLGPLLGHVVDDIARHPANSDRLQFSRPETPVLANIDPDAFAILAGNLIDNALRHSPEGSPVYVNLDPDGQMRVTNDSPRLPADQLAGLTKRFLRHDASRKGFGLGLFIANSIARQSGGKLTLRSPASGREDGFEAVFEAARDTGTT